MIVLSSTGPMVKSSDLEPDVKMTNGLKSLYLVSVINILRSNNECLCVIPCRLRILSIFGRGSFDSFRRVSLTLEQTATE